MSDLLPIPATTMALIQRVEQSDDVNQRDMGDLVNLAREVQVLHKRLFAILGMEEPTTLKGASIEQLTDELIERTPAFIRDAAREKLAR